MSNYTIELLDKLTKDVEEKMERDLVEYESNHGIDLNYKKFSMVLSSSSGSIIAALNAYTVFSEIYIDDLWVDEPNRGKGYGKKLLQALEDHFRGKGFNNINLVTSEFQAPGFYKKCGFIVEFVRKNIHHPKLTKTIFVKYFDGLNQTQGIIQEENHG